MRLENNPTELQFVINTSTSNKNIDKLFKRNNIELQAKIIKFKLKKKKKVLQEILKKLIKLASDLKRNMYI